MSKMAFHFTICDAGTESLIQDRSLEQLAAEREAREILYSYSDQELIELLARDGIIVEQVEMVEKPAVSEQIFFKIKDSYRAKLIESEAICGAEFFPAAS